MGWLSRVKKSAGDQSTGEGTAVPPPPSAPGHVGAPTPTTPMGRYGPLVSVTSFDQAPVELTWQTPVNGELYRLVPGPDRPGYSVMVLERPIHFYPPETFDTGRVPDERRVPDRKGRPMVRVDALVVCSRFVGQQLHPGMKDLPVNIAYVIDEGVLTEPSLDFGKIEYAAIGLLTEGRVEREPEPSGPPAAPSARPPAPPPAAPPATAAAAPPAMAPAAAATAEDERALGEAARALREGVEQLRGARVEHLTATLTLDAGRVVGLTGVADGTPPVPTPETFDRINTALGALPPGASAPLEALDVTVVGDRVTWQARHRN